MNIVLIGFRCSGKSTVGKSLAKRLRRPFTDSDEYIEAKTHLPIREIFDLAGESYFRTLEGQAIVDLSRLDGQIIATGGGAALKRQNMKSLRRNGLVIARSSAARPPGCCRASGPADAWAPSSTEDAHGWIRIPVSSRSTQQS